MAHDQVEIALDFNSPEFLELGADKWTECQKNLFQKIVNAYESHVESFGLYGGGGVGKTYIASAVITYLLKIASRSHYSSENPRALMIAPTNSAVKSLKRAFKDSDQIFSGLDFKTTHSALGIQPDFDNTGRIVFSGKNDQEWNYSVIFVDEASMVQRDIANQILEQSKRSGAFLIASGDRPQLPPVGEETSTLMDSMQDSYTMTTTVRQKITNPITKVIKHCRDAVEQVTEKFDPRNEYWESITDENRKGYHVYYDDVSGLRQIIRAYVKAYHEQRFDFVKLGCFTNRKCKIHNDYIRSQLWGDFATENEYIVGDLVLCKAPVTEDRIDPITSKMRRFTLMTTGTECIVKSVKPIELEYKERVLDWSVTLNSMSKPVGVSKQAYKTHVFKGWEIAVEDVDPLDGCNFEVTVQVIDQVEKPRFNNIKETVRKDCVDYQEQTRRNVWFNYYNILELFHNFVHSYCVTIHSLQGKTFDVIGVDFADITNYAPNDLMRNKLIYVGVSRAREHIISI